MKKRAFVLFARLKKLAGWMLATPGRCYAVLLALVLACHLLGAGVRGVGYLAGWYADRSLTMVDFEQLAVEVVDDTTIISTEYDPQLIYTAPDGEAIRSFEIQVEHSANPGEQVVFYSFNDQYAFSERRMVYAWQVAPGRYRFSLPPLVRQIRFDPAAFPSVTCSFESIRVNALTPNALLRFSRAELLCLLVVPGLVYGILHPLLSGQDAGPADKKLCSKRRPKP